MTSPLLLDARPLVPGTAMSASMQVGHVSSLLVRHVAGAFHSRSNLVPNAFPTGRNETKAAVFTISKERGRAGEIRTRGLLVPNQALYRAKLPPASRIALRNLRGRREALNCLARERKRALILDRSSASSACSEAARLRSGALPNERAEPAPPILNIDPALPIERIDPALPMLRIDPALPMLRTEPALNMLPRLRKL